MTQSVNISVTAFSQNLSLSPKLSVMYNIARAISCTSVSVQTLRTLRTSCSQVGFLKRIQSIAFFPFLDRDVPFERVAIRSNSQFCIHPEKLKQMVKARDGQSLCNFFASEAYKNRISAIAEEQKRVLNEDTGMGLQEYEIKYEHILNCAQPSSVRKQNINKQEENTEEGIITLLDNEKKRMKPIKTTILSLLLRKKKHQEQELDETRYGSRSTIVPLVMKTKKKNMELKKKFRKKTMILPIFLKKKEQRTQASKLDTKSGDTKSKLNQIQPQASRKEGVDEPHEEPNKISGKVSFLGSRNLTTSTNGVSISEFSQRYGRSDEQQKNIQGFTTPYEASRGERRHKQGMWGGVMRKWKPAKRKQRKQETSSPLWEMNIPMVPQYELDAGVVDFLDTSTIKTRSENRAKGMSCVKTSDGIPVIEDIITLFDRVKLDSMNKPPPPVEGEKYSNKNSCQLKPPSLNEPSLTYRVVSGDRERREHALMKTFYENAIYLLKIPKTTPEGYRVLLYSVRDNDPTKMNFSDCVKAFCMYNDIILSEDGLQEGYIVIFDMKGVQLGHLARVSLPALRCFMLYIQEAHPCRLKAIHVLNTASWIHHVMRLIVPLVKSEILNLVQFHRGDTPENFPLELLPAEYGGEAASVQELHKETTELLRKYQQWMVESAEYKSDESKRAKKASWWGLFGSSKSNAELDEKTILKNLQID